MFDLFILRHAEAVDESIVGGSDRDRYLTEHGRKQAMRAANVMRKLGLMPPLIWSSPYPRAAQTAEIVAKNGGREIQLESMEFLECGMEPLDFVAALRGEVIEMGSLMVVGHNPDLEWLTDWLVGCDDNAGFKIKKASLLSLKLALPARRGCGQLQGMMTSAWMKQLLTAPE